MCLTICADLVCCAGSSICSGCCLCCKSCCGTSMKQQVKITYIIIQALAMIFTIVFLYYASDLLEPFSDYIHCSDQTGGKWVCLGVSSVYRMSLALAIIHFVVFLACLTKSGFSKAMNEGCWFLKIAGLFTLWVLFFFVPNSFFEGYSEFAKFIGGLFLFFQIVMIVDLGYMWGENWMIRYENGAKMYAGLLIVASLVFYVTNLVLNIYMFIWFAPQSECGLHIFLVVLNLLLCIGLTILTLSGIAKNGSLLTIGKVII